ncbi:hypothetical protein KY331_00940 [Candidatus Woesearchaeota archaeon]|nr:hypothetical protein [Candidatus Woesearchaeota archaeon]
MERSELMSKLMEGYESPKKTIGRISDEACMFAYISTGAFCGENFETARERYLTEKLGEDGPRYEETLMRTAGPEELPPVPEFGGGLDLSNLDYERSRMHEVHRDIKPTNAIVIRDENGNPKVHTDFGVRRIYPTKEDASGEGTKQGE